MSVRHVVLVAHRWLGLSTAVVLSIVAATGAVLVWPTPSPRRRLAGLLHEQLAMGRGGTWIVFGSTVVAVVVLLCGLLLWWKRRVVVVRRGAGWRQALFDLHHSLGVFGFLFMFMLALTGSIMLAPPQDGGLLPVMVNLHTARGYPYVIKLLYVLGTTAFVIQAVTGLVMWWKPGRQR